MRLRWTPEAADNLQSIYTYLQQHHPSFAEPTVGTLYDAAPSLRTLPERGRYGAIPGTREFVLPRLPYVIVYRIIGDAIEVLHIYHAAQNR